jgi:hypothetical protein
MGRSKCIFFFYLTSMVSLSIAEMLKAAPILLRRRSLSSGECYGCELEDEQDHATPAPTPYPDIHRSSGAWTAPASSGIDFLVAAFFLIAAGWLFLALVYSLLVFLVVRMRARGQLDVYDENFGRIYLIGRHCYIPLGCILRRYIVAMEHDNAEGNTSVRLMTREERRQAMELLLTAEDPINTMEGGDKEESPVGASFMTEDTADDSEGNGSDCEPLPPMIDSEDHENNKPADEVLSAQEARSEGGRSFEGSAAEPVCSICLMEYGKYKGAVVSEHPIGVSLMVLSLFLLPSDETDVCYQSTTCPHRFHRECILDWLERRNNTECPCCRVPMVSDEDVWDTVQKIRREKRKQLRRQRGIFSRVFQPSPAEEENAPPYEQDVEMSTPDVSAAAAATRALDQQPLSVQTIRTSS